MNAMKARIVERHEAIDQNHAQNEQLADQRIVTDLRNVASACAPQSPGPEVKQKLETIAAQYEQCPNRDDRDQLLYQIAPVLLKNHSAIGQFLAAVACLGITFIAPAATMIGAAGQNIDGHSVDDDPSDGVHKLVYDTDGNRIPDHQAWVDDDTNEQIGESEQMGIQYSFRTFFEAIFG
ncbi:unnamed protein product [Rhizoctonia solani]|uniref:Uncharacterized protein n=1 Tax=Rhizoctonia solani TaxID=456999 RepID=A0A8H2XAP5_9AGAM|nr:unnamed protein product [Rhizoctonia solani]